ncbi:MAG: hypothetical protein M3R55_01775, partial [Acidobacteriota bacterium]|nr:hypothetical protein [Acidobacteriota bacterium]
RHFPKPLEFEIVRNLRFNPQDKLAFEYAKTLFSEARDQEAMTILRSITEKLNADWRAVYRSFYLLHLIARRQRQPRVAARYAALCKRCHANFPLLRVAAR